MPELPEVETVRRGLEPVMVGARLTRVRQNRPDLRFPFPDRFVERLEGATVTAIDRRAKYLLTRLSTGETWVTHLGMTGRFTLDGTQVGEFEEPAPIAGKHEHMSFCAVRERARFREYDPGGFADARRFGFMGLIPTDQVESPSVVRRHGARAAGQRLLRRPSGRGLRRQEAEHQGQSAGPAQRRGSGQYLCLRGAVPGADLAPDRGGQTLEAPARDPGLGDPRRAQRRHRGGRLDAEGFRQRRGRAGLFPAPVRRLWPRGQALSSRDGCTGVVKRIVQAGRSTFYCPSCQKK
jgi:formamidopyrimidine-DNA glycosylase